MPMAWRWPWQRNSAIETGPLYPAVRDAMRDIQAYARSHGGDIALLGVDEAGDVKIKFRGACVHCPLSAVTLKAGVEDRLREMVPGIGRIIQV